MPMQLAAMSRSVRCELRITRMHNVIISELHWTAAAQAHKIKRNCRASAIVCTHVQEQHSDKTWAIVSFFAWDFSKVEFPQCEPP